MRVAGFAFGALLSFLLSGCTGDATGPAAASGDEAGDLVADPTPEPQSMAFEFGLGAAFGTPVMGAILPIEDQRMVSFEVPAGHRLLEATVVFECDAAPVCELDVELRKGEQSLVTANTGPSPLTLTVDDPEEGRYTFWAFPSRDGSVVTGMQGTLTVDLP